MLELVPASVVRLLRRPMLATNSTSGRRLTASARAPAVNGDALGDWQWTAHTRCASRAATLTPCTRSLQVAVLDSCGGSGPAALCPRGHRPCPSHHRTLGNENDLKSWHACPRDCTGSGCGRGWPLERSGTKRSGAWPHGRLGCQSVKAPTSASRFAGNGTVGLADVCNVTGGSGLYQYILASNPGHGAGHLQ